MESLLLDARDGDSTPESFYGWLICRGVLKQSKRFLAGSRQISKMVREDLQGFNFQQGHMEKRGLLRRFQKASLPNERTSKASKARPAVFKVVLVA